MGDRHERPETATLTRTAFVSRAITPPSFPPTFGGVFVADFPLKTTTTGEEDEIKYDETKKTHQRPLHVKGVLLHQVLGICAEKNIRIERASQRYAREDARGGGTRRATTSRRRGTLNLSRVPTVSQQRKLKQTPLLFSFFSRVPPRPGWRPTAKKSRIERHSPQPRPLRVRRVRLIRTVKPLVLLLLS